MAYHQDWLMRQIEAISAMLAYILFGKAQELVSIPEDEETSADCGTLWPQLQALLEKKQVCEAENLLFEAMEEPTREVLDAGRQFYAQLNTWSDADLKASNFSRDEIYTGLQELCRSFGIPT